MKKSQPLGGIIKTKVQGVFTREDFLKALKRAGRRVRKPSREKDERKKGGKNEQGD